MATTIRFSGSIVHFRYPFQKTIANPVLSHGMIKLLKPPHTTRIAIRALRNDSRSELSFNGTERKFRKCWTDRIRDRRGKYICEHDILELLKSPLDTNLLKLSEDLSDLLEHMGTHSEDRGGLVYLYEKILTKPEHITNMWEIAGYNHTNKAADMLPHENQLPVKWGGRSVTSGRSVISGHKRKRHDEDQQKLFPLKSIWQMLIHRGHNGDAYEVDFEGKSVIFSRLPEGILGEEKSKSGLVSAEKNRIPGTQEPFDLAFKFGAEGPWLDQFVLYTRYAGPNVLVGKVWKENQAEIIADLVIIKMEYP